MNHLSSGLLLLIGCPPADRADAPPSLALTHVTLIDGRGGPPLSDATIIVRSGRISTVGASSRISVPSGARVLDLRNHFVTPGFIDMHYHVTTGAMRYRRTPAGALDSTYDRALAERLLRVALSRGITTTRDPGASPLSAAVALRGDVARGGVLGPRIFTAGPILSSPRLTEPEIRSAIRDQAAAGVDFIKLYARITPSQLRIAVDEAHRHGLKVIGHLQRTSWTEAAQDGIDFIAHAGNWHETYIPESHRADYAALGRGMRARIAWLEWLQLGAPAVDSMVSALAQRGVSVDPTLVAYHTKFWWRDSIYQKDPDTALVPEVLANWRVLGMPTGDWTAQEFDRVQAVWPKQLGLIRRLHQGGVLLTVGSDLASPWVIPGVAFHQELELLESAGVSRGDVLRMATRNGAQALGIAGDVGTVEVGKRADLVVLEADPLAKLANTRRIRHVVLGGIAYTPADLLKGSASSQRKDR
ncbi:MAG TPA: amidohydrolase family protein [Gemmatimonadales bacterium]|nr:amidohydrolase family protein [Gemmatimonadales bacterium]